MKLFSYFKKAEFVSSGVFWIQVFTILNWEHLFWTYHNLKIKFENKNLDSHFKRWDNTFLKLRIYSNLPIFALSVDRFCLTCFYIPSLRADLHDSGKLCRHEGSLVTSRNAWRNHKWKINNNVSIFPWQVPPRKKENKD